MRKTVVTLFMIVTMMILANPAQAATISSSPDNSVLVATPESLFPPNPAKIGEYIASFTKLGLDFGQALVTGIVTPTFKFITDMTTILAGGPNVPG